eukprot:TRINITY_DN2237_c0_g1_i13.p1 TRINITY_DN2237_c0_g1~~TRINITY_DN2237_c0_g1_i13.p1  ORF type:complete len:272 (+),score=72.11 TRINITY_DN2237_c0_g1_i13:2947-3762(+)
MKEEGIVEITLQPDASRVVLIRSNKTIQNKTNAPVHLMITTSTLNSQSFADDDYYDDESNSNIAKHTLVLEPEETFRVPLAFVNPSFSLYLKPQADWPWAKKVHDPVTCELRGIWSVNTPVQYTEIGTNQFDSLIMITPQVVIRSSFDSEFFFKIDNNGEVMLTKEEPIQSITNIGNFAKCSAQFNLPQYGSTINPINLNSIKNSDAIPLENMNKNMKSSSLFASVKINCQEKIDLDGFHHSRLFYQKQRVDYCIFFDRIFFWMVVGKVRK